jgi:hypothetical protein
VLRPDSVADPLFLDYVNQMLFERPHATIPIVWKPLTADDDNNKTIAEWFETGGPPC